MPCGQISGVGWKRAATCGAIVGGLVVLGLFGVEEPGTVGEYYCLSKTGMRACWTVPIFSAKIRSRGVRRSLIVMTWFLSTLAEQILREKGKI